MTLTSSGEQGHVVSSILHSFLKPAKYLVEKNGIKTTDLSFL